MTCSIDGCARPTLARGWCSKHYQRWLNHGDPTFITTFPARRLNARGYVLLRCPDHPCAFGNGWVLEHRKVWYDAHGAISADVHIHHINGDKADNRLENLEAVSAREHHQRHNPGLTTPCIKCGSQDWYYPPSVSNRRCRVCVRRRENARAAGLPGGG